MIPEDKNMMYCIVHDGELVNGANGWAIGWSESEAWAAAIDPHGDSDIERAKSDGHYVRRCAIMILNPGSRE